MFIAISEKHFWNISRQHSVLVADHVLQQGNFWKFVQKLCCESDAPVFCYEMFSGDTIACHCHPLHWGYAVVLFADEPEPEEGIGGEPVVSDTVTEDSAIVSVNDNLVPDDG